MDTLVSYGLDGHSLEMKILEQQLLLDLPSLEQVGGLVCVEDDGGDGLGRRLGHQELAGHRLSQGLKILH